MFSRSAYRSIAAHKALATPAARSLPRGRPGTFLPKNGCIKTYPSLTTNTQKRCSSTLLPPESPISDSGRRHSSFAAAAVSEYNVQVSMPLPSLAPKTKSTNDRLAALRERLAVEDTNRVLQPSWQALKLQKKGSSRQNEPQEQVKKVITADASSVTTTAKADKVVTSKPQDIAAVLAKLPDIPLYQNLYNDNGLFQEGMERSLNPAYLTDTHGRMHNYLRLSLTERCNLRCVYCMPEQGVPLSPPDHLLQTNELLHLARYFRMAGVTKFRLTGGEPTLRKDLVDVVAGLSELKPDSIGITTNGITLARLLPDLQAAGLSSVNLSLDSLDAEKFGAMTRRPSTYLSKVMEAMEAVLDAGMPLKLNCVVMRGTNDNEVADFIRMTDRYPKMQVRFIEYMPFTENGWDWNKCVPYNELVESLPEDAAIVPLYDGLDPNDTTKWYVTATTGAKIGFISSMSSHFCASCNRIRLTSDGLIKVCLFDGTVEVSLRDALRQGFDNPRDLSKLVHYALSKKHPSLGGHKDPQDIMADSANNRPMTLIGG